MDENRIGEAIRVARTRKRLSQKELATECGIAISSISAYENGGKVPPLDTAFKIAKALDMSLDEVGGLSNPGADNITDFERIIRAVNAAKLSGEASVLIEYGTAMRITINIRQKEGPDGWLQSFALKWNILLESLKSDPVFGELLDVWLDTQIKAVNERQVVLFNYKKDKTVFVRRGEE